MSDEDEPLIPPSHLTEEIPESAYREVVVPIRPGIGEQFEVSEDAIAVEFTKLYGETMKFDHDVGKWYQWQGTHWKMLNVPVAFQFAREIGRKLSAGKKQMCKASVAGGAERFAKAANEHRATSQDWDQDPYLLGTPEGTIDLRKGTRRKSVPEFKITKITGCAPEAGVPKLWLKFLHDCTNGDEAMIQYLQRIAGYCLTGLTTEHALFFIYGPGGNGKSVFLNMLVYILGDYAVSAPMDTFTSGKFNSHPTELAMLKGARLVTASETEEGRSWAEARIKALTGGDPISARFMRQDFFTFQPQFKLLFAGNHQPTLSAVDPAMKRRFNMLPFVHRPPEPDHMLEIKLREEAGKILVWMLKGCMDWQAQGLGRPETVTLATDEYFEEQDVFGQWLEERTDRGVGRWEIPTMLFRDWTEYAREHGESVGTMVSFTSRLKKSGFMRAKVSGVRAYKGLSLKQADRGDDGWGQR